MMLVLSRAHGCILSAASPVFKAMLASGMAEGLSSSMTVDADPSELLAMLRFIYLGELDATGQQLPGTKKCGDRELGRTWDNNLWSGIFFMVLEGGRGRKTCCVLRILIHSSLYKTISHIIISCSFC